MSIDTWPKHTFGGKRHFVISANAQAAAGQQIFQIELHSSSGDSLTVQLAGTALRNLVETALSAMGEQPKAKARRPRKAPSKP